MDYETLFAFTGLYILFIVTFYYQVRLTKRMIKIEEAVADVVIQVNNEVQQVKNELINERWGKRRLK